jgi:nitrite reductase/ring-hydroxylating ferredoxin subunit
MTERVLAGDTETLSEQGYLSASIDGTGVAVVEFGGSYYAIERVCKHQGGNLCTGSVRRSLVATHSEIGKQVSESYADSPAIACPRHGWEYSLDSGDHLGDDSISLDVFDVVVEDGQVFVSAE